MRLVDGQLVELVEASLVLARRREQPGNESNSVGSISPVATVFLPEFSEAYTLLLLRAAEDGESTSLSRQVSFRQ